MGKISNKRIYETVTPTGSDYLIGTDAEDRNKTKNFKIQAIADFVGKNVTIGVGSLNTLTGSLTLVGGDGLTITDNGSDTITISMDRPDYVESINSLIGAVDIVGSTNIVVTDNGTDTITVDTQNLAKTNEANTFVSDQTMTKNLSVGTTVFNVDSIAERVGVNTATPSKSFDVVGDAIIQGLTGNVLTLKSPSENGDNYILFTNSLDSDKGWVGYRGTSNILQIDNLIDDIDISSLTGSVKLSLGGSVKLETTASGIEISGDLTTTGNATVNGLTALFDPIDAQGDFRARSNIRFDAYAPISGHNLLEVGTDGTVFTFPKSDIVLQTDLVNVAYTNVNNNFSVDQTINGNLTTTGTITATSVDGGNAAIEGWSADGRYARFGHKDLNNLTQYGYLQFEDSTVYLKSTIGIFLEANTTINGDLTTTGVGTFGTTDSLKLYHDNNTDRAYIKTLTNTSQLLIEAGAFLALRVGGTQNALIADNNGPVSINYSGATKIATTSFGATITGDVVADSHITNGGTSSDFVKGDGSLDSTNYQGQIDAEEAARIAADSALQVNIDNEEAARIAADIDLANDISTKQDISEKNQANGYAPLDSGAKIPIANLPDSVVGQVEYQGTWNASTNTPTLPAASGVKGHYYVVSVGGTYETIVYAVGDWIISNGTAWEKVDNTDAVTSVFGRLGAILANESDYSSFYPLLGTTISAGTGLTGGGDLSANRTISHADTSSQGSLNNSGGVVIQDVTLDPFGHVSGLGSIDLDGRYVQTLTDTLDSVTDRGATTTNVITVGNIVLTNIAPPEGDFMVTINETGALSFQIIPLNSANTLDSVTDNGSSTANAITVGGATINGNLTISNNSNPAVNIKDSGQSGTSATPYFRFQDSANTSIGVMGFISGSSGAFQISNQKAGGSILLDDNTTINGNLTVSSGIKNASTDGSLTIKNFDHGENIILQGETTGGSFRDMLTLDPDTGAIFNLGASFGGNLTVNNTLNSTIRLNASDTSILSGDNIGTIEWYTNDTSSSGTGVSAQIQAFAENDFTGGNRNTSIAFSTVLGTGSLTERMRIDSSGVVKIIGGSNAFLDLDRLTSGNAARLRYATGGTDEFEAGLIGGVAGYHITDGSANPLMTIDSSGNVGIGTTNPRADASTIGLTIGNATTGAAQLVLEENTLAGGWRIFSNGYLGFFANNDERMRISSSGNVSIGSSTTDERLKLSSAGTGASVPAAITLYGNNGGAFGSSNVVRSKIDSVTDGTAFGSIMRFYTNDTSNAYQERMRIDSSGNVGIGRSPSSGVKLDVNGATSIDDSLFIQGTTPRIYLTPDSTTGFSEIRFGDSTDTDVGEIQYSNADDSMSFRTNAAERLRIDSSGNLSVSGIATLGQKLVVNSGNDFSLEFNRGTKTISHVFSTNGFYGIQGLSGYIISMDADNLNVSIGGSTSITGSLGTANGSESAPTHTFYSDSNTGMFRAAVDTLAFSTNGVERMRIDSSGSLLLGKTSANIDIDDGFRLDQDGSLFACIPNAESSYYVRDITNLTYRFRVSGAGTVFATSTTISSISDERLKENIRDLDSGLDKIMLLKPRLFDWKEGSRQNGKDIRGFIAQEVEEFFPELIDEWSNEDLEEGEEAYKSVRMDVIPILVKAIQELKAEIDLLKSQNH